MHQDTKTILVTGAGAIGMGWIGYFFIKHILGVTEPSLINALCLVIVCLSWPCIVYWRGQHIDHQGK